MPLKYVRLIFFFAFLILLGWFVASIKGILLPFVFGILLAYLFDPLVDRLERWKLSRSVATTLVIFGFFLIFALALLLLLPPLIGQVSTLVSSLPAQITALQHNLMPKINGYLHKAGINDMDDIQQSAGDMAQKALAGSLTVGAVILKSGLAVFDVVALLVIAPVVSFYFLRDFDILVAKLDALLPRYYAETIREEVREINRVISAFLRGQLNVCLALAVYYTVGLVAIRLHYSLLIGLFSGLIIVIPYVGAPMAGVIALAVGYFQSDGDLHMLAKVGGVYLVGHLLEGYVLTPRLMGKSLGLHPMWIIFGMLAGGTLLGFVGVLIAVPVTAVIGVLVRSGLRLYLASPLYSSSFIRHPQPEIPHVEL